MPGTLRVPCFYLCTCARWVTRKCLTRVVRLDATEPLQLLRLYAHLLAKANLADSTANERRPVRVHRLVYGCSARLGPNHRDACLSTSTSSRCLGHLVTIAEVLDNCGLHRELDQVEGNKPDDILPRTHQNTWHEQMEKKSYPNPNYANPGTRNLLDVCESPIRKTGDDRGDKLRQAECTHQRKRWTLHEKKSMRASDENECLRDDCNLEVDNGV